jgi:hypothetical protein
VRRLINVEMVSLFALLFLAGLEWINFSQLVPNTTYDLSNDKGYYLCPMLAYFIITFVILAIALLQFRTSPAMKSSATPSRSGGRCPSRTSSIFAASPTSPSSSSTRPCTGTTSTA